MTTKRSGLLHAFLPAMLAALPMAAAGPVRGQPATVAPGAAERRIAALQAGLQITTEQLPAWNSFAQAMRDNEAATDALFRDRAANARLMGALDNMKSYAAVAQAYADDTRKLSDSFGVLYAALSDRQKGLADAIFRQQPAQPPPPPSGGPRR